MYILSESETRAEYKRRWKAIARARKHGLDIGLIERLYALLCEKGYDRATILECLCYCAETGVFGRTQKR